MDDIMIPTLDQVTVYDPQHLMSAAQYWDETAQLWEDTLGEFHASAMGLDFHGRTAEAVRESAARQHQGAVTDADKLRQAAAVASNAADELRQSKQRVLDLVKHATDNQFMVSPTYQVTDTSGSHNSDSAARQAAAQQISADLVRYAGELWTHDADTAGRMVQAVDFHDPPPGPTPPGQQWNYRPDTGWQLDDHLKDCGGPAVTGDIIGIVGGVVAAPALPSLGGMLAEINAARSAFDINQCEGP
jgi:hypothetical protein